MFQNKRIRDLESRVYCLEQSVLRFDALLSAVQPPQRNPFATEIGELPERVTLWDLVAEFRNTHVKVKGYERWEPKPKR